MSCSKTEAINVNIDETARDVADSVEIQLLDPGRKCQY